MKLQLFLTFICYTLIISVYSYNNGLGRTPQMGWNSWNKFACKGLNQQVVMETAKFIKESGFIDLGYEYINLDDCWQIARNETTKEIIPDSEKFPDGIAALANYIHSLGLKFGLYSDAGTHTCAGRPGSLGYEEIDAKTYAKWGVDYLKYDNCHNKFLKPQPRYEAMYKALNETGRPIFYSMCEWGQYEPWTWAPAISNSWRTTGDIKDHWSSFTSILEKQADLYKYAQPGAWNDPDMLEVGNGGMTTKQYQVQFSFWCLLKAPLLIGCDVTNMSEETKNILGNKEVIAVNQDPLGKQGFRLFKGETDKKKYEIWGIPQNDGSVVIIIWNTGKSDEEFSVSLSFIQQKFDEIGYPCKMTKKVQVRDLIERSDLPRVTGEIYAIIESEYIVMYKLTPIPDSLEQIE